ncbi:MAG: cation transporter [Proteobacteria bacterium]|nr:cation transporter [Pseudomonadota bacterium]
MNKLVSTLAIVVALAGAPALAGEAGTTGKVNAVDAANHTVNLTHGPIDALGWPGMTMTFAVLPNVDLGAVTAGETVSFTVVQTPSGAYAVDMLMPEH